MKNWSANQVWNPKEFHQPSTSEEIQAIVKNAVENNRKIRVYGSKHSFTALNNTNDVCINLDNFQGLISVDKEKKQVTVKAGTKLYNLTKLLAELDLAPENMGDVDRQSIAGAISTGTHGTGVNFGNISTQIISLKFINGKGEEIFCSENENQELFKCLQVSLGVFGIITEVTLQCVENYKLELVRKAEKLTDVLKSLDTHNQEHRNFEFYWLPYTNKVQTKYSNITENKTDTKGFMNYINDVVIENYVFKVFCEIAKLLPSLNAFISKLSAKFVSGSVKVKECKDVYATPRLVKFNEMEYNIPIEDYQDCMKEITELVNSKKFKIHFPMENRFVKGDDIYMSPAYQRDSAYIACHVYKGKEYDTYFKALEAVFEKYNGRPHWGKMHYKNSEYFKKVYPKYEIFNQNRREHDPKNIFLNAHLQDILI